MGESRQRAGPTADAVCADIVCDRVGKVYRAGRESVEAVSSVSFAVQRGEFVSLLGPSGCGKSTLLMIIGGVESVSRGTVHAAGRPVEGPRTEIGIMFQEPTLLPWKSAIDNVLFPVLMMRRPRKQYEGKALELLRTMGLAGFEHKKPRQLSGGMRQRVAICRALLSDPDLLLMDEPFSALDAITRDEMNALLLQIWQRYRKTALFVTHSIREAVLLSDRVLVMSRRPSTIVSDVPIPFPRPRDFSLSDSAEFNDLCSMFRREIGQAHNVAPPD